MFIKQLKLSLVRIRVQLILPNPPNIADTERLTYTQKGKRPEKRKLLAQARQVAKVFLNRIKVKKITKKAIPIGSA
jgi:hypothetical protein